MGEMSLSKTRSRRSHVGCSRGTGASFNTCGVVSGYVLGFAVQQEEPLSLVDHLQLGN